MLSERKKDRIKATKRGSKSSSKNKLSEEEKEGLEDSEEAEQARSLKREDGEKIKLAFGTKSAANKPTSPPLAEKNSPPAPEKATPFTEITDGMVAVPPPKEDKIAMKITMNKPKNVFSGSSKKNALGGTQGANKSAPQKPMSQAEKIMREEIERKRQREARGLAGPPGAKRQKVA
jgi:DNA/RNA-binding protein KIN17